MMRAVIILLACLALPFAGCTTSGKSFFAKNGINVEGDPVHVDSFEGFMGDLILRPSLITITLCAFYEAEERWPQSGQELSDFYAKAVAEEGAPPSNYIAAMAPMIEYFDDGRAADILGELTLIPQPDGALLCQYHVGKNSFSMTMEKPQMEKEGNRFSMKLKGSSEPKASDESL